MTRAQPIIVWFRDDLRLSDHPALPEAAAGGAPVVGLYVRDEESRALMPPAVRRLGGATRWWLPQSLRALGKSLTMRSAKAIAGAEEAHIRRRHRERHPR